DPPAAFLVAHAPVVRELLHLGVRPLRHRLRDPREDRVASLERPVVVLDILRVVGEEIGPRAPITAAPGLLRYVDVVVVRALQFLPRPGAHQPAASAWHGLGGTSSAGLRSKNPKGISVKPVYSTGMTGQSSGRTKWVTPNEYQTTTSVPARSRSCAVHAG